MSDTESAGGADRTALLELLLLGALALVVVLGVALNKEDASAYAVEVIVFIVAVGYAVRSRSEDRSDIPWGIVWVNLVLLVVAGFLASLYIPLNVPRNPVHEMSTSIDFRIPLVKPFAIPYVTYEAFVVLTIGVTMIRRQHILLRTMLGAMVVVVGVSNLIFVVYQTIDSVRPVIVGGGFWNYLLTYIHGGDPPYSSFPSLHVGGTSVMILTWYRLHMRRWSAVAVTWGVLICASTLLIKEHVWLDVLAGATLAYTSYDLVRRFTEPGARALRAAVSND